MEPNVSFSYSYQLSTMPTWVWPFTIIACIVSLIAMWKIFTKAGEPGWKCLIPIYNVYTEFKIAYGSGWRFLLLLIPFANIVFLILFYVEFARAFGKGAGFVVGMIFLPWLFTLILAFGNAEYCGSKIARECA